MKYDSGTYLAYPIGFFPLITLTKITITAITSNTWIIAPPKLSNNPKSQIIMRIPAIAYNIDYTDKK